MDKEKLRIGKNISNEIERVKKELYSLNVSHNRLYFSKKKTYYFLDEHKLPIIELNYEQLKYLVSLKEQELRNLEKELDEL